ncbi:hypothetical protein YPPY53_0691, partial [Yersinia pestis PY-53]
MDDASRGSKKRQPL